MPKIKVGIETGIAEGKPTGVGIYVRELTERLGTGIDVTKLNVSQAHMPTWRRIYTDQVLLPRETDRHKVDLLHQPAFSCPILYKKAKKIVTVHDVIPLVYPENFSATAKLFWTKLLPYSYNFADHIIASSEATKKDICKFTSIKPSKITVVPLGISEVYKPPKIKANTAPYILFVSTLEPRKQPLFLLKIYEKIVQKEFPHKLIIVGKRGWGLESFDEYLTTHAELQKKVEVLGYITEAKKLELYQNADLLLFPSLYEGVGLPPLEAMACGCPVISSSTSSMPEVVGDAGILLEPKDENVWAREIMKTLNSKDLMEKLSQKGIVQAQKFSWESCAKQTEEVYKSII